MKRVNLKKLAVSLTVMSMMCVGMIFSSCSPKIAASVSETNLVDEETVSVGSDYALLHIYRLNRMAGVVISYDLHLGDTVICRVTNKYKETIKIKKEGLNTLWARTESKTELPVDIQFGKEYYIRCSLKMGVAVGRPNMELVNNATGRKEFQAVKKSNHQ
jgi:hypothetical protein